MKKFVFLSLFVMALVFSAAAQEAETTTISGQSDDGLLLFKSDDGKFQFMLDGRINLAAAVYSGHDNPISNGTEVRRARLGFKPKWGNWEAQFDIDFSGNEVDVKDMWVGYNGFKNTMITLGNHKSQFSVEEVTSSRYLTFLERGLPNAFAPDRRLGLSIAHWGKNWRVFAGLFGEEAGSLDEETGENEALNYNLRLNYLPVLTDNAFIHFGGSYGHSTPFANDEGRVRFRARPETHVADNRFLHTGWIDAESWDLYGLELAASAGPVLLQGEYMATSVKQPEALPRANFSGYYAFASWMITGEKRPYNVSEGEPAGLIHPRNKKLGAFELAVRVSNLCLNDMDADVMGGEANNITIGLNWRPYANFRFIVNYTFVNLDDFATGNGDYTGNDDYRVLQGGFYFSF